MAAMYELTILSIFRQSTPYLRRYLKQVEQAFKLAKGRCHAVWLEGDSTDGTYEQLLEARHRLVSMGHDVTLVKADTSEPFWSGMKKEERKHEERWKHMATCWNNCMKGLKPTKLGVCVESDLIWHPKVLFAVAEKLDDQVHVIYPQLLYKRWFGLKKRFYDRWGFRRDGQHFNSKKPYWQTRPGDELTFPLISLDVGAGMIVTHGARMAKAAWDESCCLLKFPVGTNLFVDTTKGIYHPLSK
jgi:hypothetical protein